MHDPIAYTYDADTHCPGCATARFGEDESGNVPDDAYDNGGNAVGAIFSWTEWWQIDGKCETLVCGTCGGEIAVAHNDPHSMGCPDYEPTWPRADQEAAGREGWDIFECGDSEHEPFELERLVDPASVPELGLDQPAFEDDPDAWEHVVTMATAGDGTDLHNRALLFLAYEAPGELLHVAYWRAGVGGACPCRSCRSVHRLR